MMGIFAERARALLNLFIAVARRDPSVDSKSAILALSTLMVVLAIVVLIFALVLTPSKRRVVRRRRVIRRRGAPKARTGATVVRAQPRVSAVAPPTAKWTVPRLSATAWSLLFVVLAVLLVAVGYQVSGTNRFCESYCHQPAAAPNAVDRGVLLATAVDTTEPLVAAAGRPKQHEKCTSCHREDLVTDLVARTRMGFSALTQSNVPPAAIVNSANCLKCHADVLLGTVKGSRSRLRMSHKEPQERGIPCTACHDHVGHSSETLPAMGVCVDCHDGLSAPAKCEVCHETNPPDVATTKDFRESGNISFVSLDTWDCYGCHNPARCDSCHQVRVPHTAAFIRGGHAFDAAFDKKETVCFRCHTDATCNQCHSSFAMHASGWKQEHKGAGWQARCVCHDERMNYVGAPGRMCRVCHSK